MYCPGMVRVARVLLLCLTEMKGGGAKNFKEVLEQAYPTLMLPHVVLLDIQENIMLVKHIKFWPP